MIGDIEAFRHLYDGNHFKSVIVVVGDKPDWYDPKDQDFDIPLIYTEQTNPNKLHLKYLKDQKLQLIHGKNASDEFFFAWYTHALTLGLKTLVALDSENEIYVQ